MRTSAILALLVLASVPVSQAGATPPQRAYEAGHFLLELGSQEPGLLRSAEGGGIKAEVIEAPASGAPLLTKKHLGPARYEDLVMEVYPGALAPLRDWIDAMLAGKPVRRDGAVVAADPKGGETGRLHFRDALITEVAFPACDAGAKEPAFLAVRIAPERTEWSDGTGAPVETPKADKQKLWLPSNFRLTIDGLDCRRVQKIEAFTIRQRTTEDELGENKPYTREPGRLEIPNLRAWIDAVDVKPWRDWHQSFVVEGKNGDGSELGGSLVFLAPDLATEVFHLDLHHVGIYRLTELPGEVDDPQPDRRCFVVELYVESMEMRPLAR